VTPRPILGLVAVAIVAPAFAGPAAEAFEQGTALGRAGSATARGNLTGATATTVPHFNATPPEASYFGSSGLGTPAAARVGACATPAGPAGSFADQACNAVQFSQENPARRPTYTLAPNDPLLTRARAITADPQAIAGNLAGTYSACTVETVTRPEVFETQTCHQYRTTETHTCDRILIVTPTQTPGCTAGQFLTRVSANPCPACIDTLAYDFTCGANGYRMHVLTILKANGAVHQDLGIRNVPGTLNTEIPQTAGPTQIGGVFCYQTFYSQSCSGANCTISVWFQNPCQGTSHFSRNTFAMPTTVTFTDTWDNQCAALEARAR